MEQTEIQATDELLTVTRQMAQSLAKTSALLSGHRLYKKASIS